MTNIADFRRRKNLHCETRDKTHNITKLLDLKAIYLSDSLEKMSIEFGEVSPTCNLQILCIIQMNFYIPPRTRTDNISSKYRYRS